jgi:hypothetical protein
MRRHPERKDRAPIRSILDAKSCGVTQAPAQRVVVIAGPPHDQDAARIAAAAGKAARGIKERLPRLTQQLALDARIKQARADLRHGDDDQPLLFAL